MLPREQLFVSEYLKDFNGKRAVLAAGYNAKSENTASAMGHELLRRPHIKLAVLRGTEDKLKRNQIITDTVLSRLVCHVEATPDMFKSEDGEFLPYCEVPDALKPAIKTYTVYKDKEGNETGYNYTFYDPHKAFELLGKHASMFVEKSEVNHGVTTEFADFMKNVTGKTRAL